METKLSKESANSIYDILVSMGGAPEDMRHDFIYHHCDSKFGCDEYRFGGKLGSGGKYYSSNNRVDCYTEDYTSETKTLIEDINGYLSGIIK